MGFVNALLLAGLAERFGWTVAIGVGAAFAVTGAILILLVVAAFRRPRERRIFTSKR